METVNFKKKRAYQRKTHSDHCDSKTRYIHAHTAYTQIQSLSWIKEEWNITTYEKVVISPF